MPDHDSALITSYTTHNQILTLKGELVVYSVIQFERESTRWLSMFTRIQYTFEGSILVMNNTLLGGSTRGLLSNTFGREYSIVTRKQCTF